MSKKKTQKYLSLTDLASRQMFPWLETKDIRAYRTIVEADRRKRNLLKTILIGRGRQKRYKFKEENIRSFVSEVESGTYRL